MNTGASVGSSVALHFFPLLEWGEVLAAGRTDGAGAGGQWRVWINEGRPLTDGVTLADGCFNYSPPSPPAPRSPSCQGEDGNEPLLGALLPVSRQPPQLLYVSNLVLQQHSGSTSRQARPLRPGQQILDRAPPSLAPLASIPSSLPGGIIIVNVSVVRGRHFEGQKWGRR